MKKFPLYNPLAEDFIYTLLDDDNNPVTYIIKSRDIEYYPFYLQVVLKKHLLDAIINDRDINFWEEDEIAQINKEVEVEHDN